MPSWFDFNSLEAFEIDEDIDSLQRSVTYLLSLVESEIASGVPPERIILAGFAQGGVVALNAALQSKKNLGGVMALSTWLPKRLPEPLSAGNHSFPNSSLPYLRISNSLFLSHFWNRRHHLLVTLLSTLPPRMVFLLPDAREPQTVPPPPPPSLSHSNSFSISLSFSSSSSLHSHLATSGAPKVPIWFCHGTDDRVVKYSLGLDGYHKCLSMKLDAHFKAYDGLGHEYGSQEMVDVQTFLENRIPSNPKQANAATNGLEGLLEPSIMHRSLKAMGGGSCAQQMPRRKVETD